MKNSFLTGLIIGIVTMGLAGFTAIQGTTIFQPASPAVVSVKFCTTQSQIITAVKYYADRRYLIDVNQLSSGDVIVIGKKY